MGFQSVNEIEKFSFENCRICKFQVEEQQVSMELEALIVKPDNSQNTNYTESYAGDTKVKLEQCSILSGIKDGYKYYDANDVLLKEVPDEALSQEQLTQLFASCSGAYLFSMEQLKKEDDKYYYEMSIEFQDEEDNTVADSYRLQICFTKAVFCWEQYLNRVQR